MEEPGLRRAMNANMREGMTDPKKEGKNDFEMRRQRCSRDKAARGWRRAGKGKRETEETEESHRGERDRGDGGELERHERQRRETERERWKRQRTEERREVMANGRSLISIPII